jgi:DNA-directed RNA polymerase subunit N
MEFPVRCFTCGKVIGQDYKAYKDKTDAGEDPKKVLNSLGMDRACCRRMFLSYTDVAKEAVQFRRN